MQFNDIHPDDIDPDTGRPYPGYSSPALDTSFHDHEMAVEAPAFRAPPERFTTEDAYEASEAGEPIMLTRAAAERIIEDHDCDYHEAMEFLARELPDGKAHIDAAVVLGWLGY